MEYVLETESLCKRYGKTRVLQDICLKIPKGSIYGLVGKNGAGKTTLMRIITGLQAPTSGTYTLSGVKNTDRKITTVRRRMGALVETPGLYKNLSAYDNIKLQYINLGLTSYDTIPDLLKLVNLEDAGKKHAGKFSLGMRQRLGVAIAMCGNPDILVLDEPINGLDPQGIIEMREMLLNINKERSTTILISSHILDELSRLATDYAFIDNGRILQTLSAEDLLRKTTKAARLTVSDTKAMCRVLDTMGLRYEVSSDGTIEVFGDINITRTVHEADKENVEIFKVLENDETLEAYFMNLVGNGGEQS
ncbi:ABC-2 type transport system ATP-binding protein [Oscillospiraceae bacterium]|nr:ABC-2 type transport system ATP-binding protein [Oscillospiraceae bacterium]